MHFEIEYLDSLQHLETLYRRATLRRLQRLPNTPSLLLDDVKSVYSISTTSTPGQIVVTCGDHRCYLLSPFASPSFSLRNFSPHHRSALFSCYNSSTPEIATADVTGSIVVTNTDTLVSHHLNIETIPRCLYFLNNSQLLLIVTRVKIILWAYSKGTHTRLPLLHCLSSCTSVSATTTDLYIILSSVNWVLSKSFLPSIRLF
ncbi:hypothetical protein GEMRC1_007171 [Eukaryota sp. GEM-RC1]